jgi:dolichol-phosphate mannosyltransferase
MTIRRPKEECANYCSYLPSALHVWLVPREIEKVHPRPWIQQVSATLAAFSHFGTSVALTRPVNGKPMSITRCSIEKRRLSIVVPMCNEEESIGLLAEKLSLLQERVSTQYEVEYCLVDDGSTDLTRQLMSSVVPMSARAVCLYHEVNQGLGAAIRTGLRAASGEIVCTIDADCSYPPEDLCALIDLIARGTTDIAVASPYHPQGGVVGVKPWRLLLSKQCSLIYRLISPLKLYTYTSIFRAYSGAAAKDVEFESNGFVSAVQILLSAQLQGYRVNEIPMVLHARMHGYSKIRIATTIAAHVAVVWRVAKTTLGVVLARRTPELSGTFAKVDAPLAISASFETMKKDNPIS